jgi:shikimate kinase
MKNIIIIGNRAVGKTVLAKAIRQLNPEEITCIIIDSIGGSCVYLDEMVQAMEKISQHSQQIEIEASIQQLSYKVTKPRNNKIYFPSPNKGKGARARNRSAFNNKFRK